MPRLIQDPDGFNDAGDCILIREDALHLRGDCFACDAYADREAEEDGCKCGEPECGHDEPDPYPVKTTTAEEILSALTKANLRTSYEQTGGGCGTILVPCCDEKHSVLIGPFSYYAKDEPEPFDALSIGLDENDPEWTGWLSVDFDSVAELVYKVRGLVDAIDPTKLTAEDLDAAYVSTFPVRG